MNIKKKIKLEKKKKNRKILVPKRKIISNGINNNIGFKNLRKILNKSEINPQYEKEKKNKMKEKERKIKKKKKKKNLKKRKKFMMKLRNA